MRRDQLKADFVAMASHQLRTPLTSVDGVLTMLALRGDDMPRELREQLIQTGVQQGERFGTARRTAGSLPTRLHVVRIRSTPLAVRPLLKEIAAATLGEEVPVTIKAPHDLEAVADRMVIDRVLSNLLTNAARHGAPPVTLTAEQRDGQLRIAVSDHGPGVPEELRPRLFDRFARGDDGRGSGLGLAIARAYARAHGGDIQYHPGNGGARFELALRRHSPVRLSRSHVLVSKAGLASRSAKVVLETCTSSSGHSRELVHRRGQRSGMPQASPRRNAALAGAGEVPADRPCCRAGAADKDRAAPLASVRKPLGHCGADGLAPEEDVQHDRPDDRGDDHQPDRNEDGHVV